MQGVGSEDNESPLAAEQLVALELASRTGSCGVVWLVPACVPYEVVMRMDYGACSRLREGIICSWDGWYIVGV